MQTNPQNGSSKSHLTRNLGSSIRICQLNIEGISKSKSQYLSKFLIDNEIDVAIIQETHTANEQELKQRGTVYGFTIIGATYHRSHGIATYIRNSIENAELISEDIEFGIHRLVIDLGGMKIINIYKPPTIKWQNNVLPIYSHPAVYAGDFNSHHGNWGYASNDECGTMLSEWAETANLHLVFDAKGRKTFQSARWKRGYNPDLCFVSGDNANKPVPITRQVSSDFPHSQHRPVILEIGKKIPIIRSSPRPRWNFQKAKWDLFAGDLDKIVRWIPPTYDNYTRFIGAVTSVAKKHIPRGFRKEYIPGWSATSETLYREFLESGDHEIADDLLHNLDEARLNKWQQTTEGMDFKRSSRKAWSLLRKLGNCGPAVKKKSPIHPNQVAEHIVKTSKTPPIKDHSTQIRKELSELKSRNSSERFSHPFSLEETNAAINDMKSGKAPGFDKLHPEFLINSGQNTRRWLTRFYSNILNTARLPAEFKLTKIIALIKPGKPDDKVESYRPIALLSVCYKLLERLLYNRISNDLMDRVPDYQAGFKPNRSCTDQVLALTTFIEKGYQQCLKTSVAFVDLTAAYDTVWRQGMIYKLLKTTGCIKSTYLIDSMLSNRLFQVTMSDESSRVRKLNNGLPQGSVLAPLLFNLYISDMPETTTRKFGYADDLAIAVQHREFLATEVTLSADLTILGQFFRNWRLKPSTSKTEVCCFHLNNKLANTRLHVLFNGSYLRHNDYPKYLGVTLDRTLTYKKHLSNTAAKLKTRNNIVSKLASSSWGASASTLRTAALGLVYPVAEYCAPVWLNSCHTNMVDVQLNNTMRIITGTIKPTPTYWLPVLSHIEPPSIRRSKALLREYDKIGQNPNLPIHADLPPGRKRLKSRRDPIRTAIELDESNFQPRSVWENNWQKQSPAAWRNIFNTEAPPSGFNLPRGSWRTLNRVRTNHGRCNDSLYKWGMKPSPGCDCGEAFQTISHIAFQCTMRSCQGTAQDFIHLTPTVEDWLRNLDVNI